MHVYHFGQNNPVYFEFRIELNRRHARTQRPKMGKNTFSFRGTKGSAERKKGEWQEELFDNFTVFHMLRMRGKAEKKERMNERACALIE